MYFLVEVALKNKDEELNLIILELRKSLASLQEKLAKEESEKKVRIAISFFFIPICFSQNFHCCLFLFGK